MRDLNDLEEFTQIKDLKQNIEMLYLEPLTRLNFDSELFKIAFDTKDNKLKLIRELDQKLVDQKTLKLIMQ